MSLTEITEDIKKIETADDAREVFKKYEKEFNNILKNVNDSQWKSVEDFILTCVVCGYRKFLDSFVAVIFTKKKLIQWKSHPGIFDKFFEAVTVWGQKSHNEKPDLWHELDFSKTLENVISLIKSTQIGLKKYEDTFYKFITLALSSMDNRLITVVIDFSEQVPWEKQPERIIAVFERTYEIVQEHPELSYGHDLGHAIVMLWIKVFQALQQLKPALEIVNVVTKVFLFCAEGEWVDSDDPSKETVNHQLCKYIMEDYIQRHRKKTEIVKPMFAKILELRDCGDEILERDSNNIYSMLDGSVQAELMGDNMDTVIDDFVENASIMNVGQIYEAIQSKPGAFKGRSNDISSAILDNVDDAYLSSCLSTIWELAKIYPQEFSTEVIGKLVDTLAIQETFAIGFMPLGALAPHRKEDLLPHDEAIIKCMHSNHSMSSQGTVILVQLATLGKEHARKYMRELVKLAKIIDPSNGISMIHSLGQIGGDFREEMAEHREYLQELLSNPNLKQYAQQALDILEGRSLKKVAEEVTDQKEDIKQLDEKVTETEQKVDDVEKDVQRLDTDVVELKTDVAEQGEKINELEVVVDETAEKVEEIDKKTLSHAPVWSRDVAKLMNPEAEHDWRLLAQRLGYTNDDIRNWATQADPCMSLLDEWFATHKTREATFAVEEALNEMNRVDAAMIVENALKQAEGVVEEDDTEEWDPPPIFISYQWGLQQEVKLLHRHLEMAGYKSWMDIGQMGGGDKLFAKIDQGLRAAKVVISCVSEKYAKSANCNREVNLAVNLGKPIIPLLMEKISWPPPGSMGPIFGEYIFVRFFARPGETAGDDRYWPTAKFQELLMQLRYTHAPEPSIITSDLYKDWWNPPEEIIIIQPKGTKNQQTQAAAEKEKAESESPDVFISYQWGKQPQIKKLYKTLTSKGYVCWLDIMQMGGGDSLFDKIDKGIRGCKVVLSCVTSKYALSANCRREVSLADALKKPIVPLLLEKGTWPPVGPMSMVFTQLLYIDFCKPDIEVQNTWTCPQMDELYGKLMTYAPSMKPIEASPKNAPKVAEPKPADKPTDDNVSAPIPSQYTDASDSNQQKNPQEKPADRSDDRKETVKSQPKSNSNNTPEPNKKSSSCALL